MRGKWNSCPPGTVGLATALFGFDKKQTKKSKKDLGSFNGSWISLFVCLFFVLFCFLFCFEQKGTFARLA